MLFQELEELHVYLKNAFPAVFKSPFIAVNTVNSYSLLLEVEGANSTGDKDIDRDKDTETDKKHAD